MKGLASFFALSELSKYNLQEDGPVKVVFNFLLGLPNQCASVKRYSALNPSIFDTIPAMLLVSFGIHLP